MEELDALTIFDGQLVEVLALQPPVWQYSIKEGIVTRLSKLTPEDHECLAENGAWPGRCLAWYEDEQVHLVETHGMLLGIPEGYVKDAGSLVDVQGGYDFLWPGEKWSELVFAAEVSESLARKGHCVVRGPYCEPGLHRLACAATKNMAFRVLESELEAAYLGHDSKSKVCEVAGPHDGLDTCDRLAAYEAMFETITNLLLTLPEEALHFQLFGRSRTLIRVPNDSLSAMALSSVDVELGTLENSLEFLQRRKVSMLYVVAGSGGTLRFYPREGLGWQSSQISLRWNQLFIFRHDLMGYSYAPIGDSLALQCWLYSQPLLLEFERMYGGTDESQCEALGCRGPRLPHPESPCAVSFAARLPTEANMSHEFWPMLLMGTDGVIEWPSLRWEANQYYDSNDAIAVDTGKSWSKHGSFLEDIVMMSFDCVLFGLREDEVEDIDPQQRVLLEVGYECVTQANCNKGEVSGARLGIFTGIYDSFWESVHEMHKESTADHISPLLAASQLSHHLGTCGPVVRIDTACSSSLVAVCAAHYDLQRWQGCYANLVMAAMGHLSPFSWPSLCKNGMLSRIGRCSTFDASADGFAKGEGFGAACLKFERSASSWLAALPGSFVNQDGRSASITAPNGPAQQALIRSCFEAAGIDPVDVRMSECHGTGTALGDAIEVGALHASLLAMQPKLDPIMFTAVKGNLAHMEACAGMSGVFKIIALLHYGMLLQSIHIKTINPYLATEGFPWYALMEVTDLPQSDSFYGVQGFGMGGTNARAEFWGRVKAGGRAPGPRSIDLTKAAFISVRCSNCKGRMCWLCRVAEPAEQVLGVHRCSQIREPDGDQESCSDCYSGEYIFRMGS